MRWICYVVEIFLTKRLAAILSNQFYFLWLFDSKCSSEKQQPRFFRRMGSSKHGSSCRQKRQIWISHTIFDKVSYRLSRAFGTVNPSRTYHWQPRWGVSEQMVWKTKWFFFRTDERHSWFLQVNINKSVDKNQRSRSINQKQIAACRI